MLGQAEELIATASDDERRDLGVAMAPLVADEVGLDLEQASDEAMAFLESFPVPGRAAVDRADEAARWLALRMATDARRARLREGLEELAEAAAADYPLMAEVLMELAREPAPSNPREDDLWVALARAIVDERLPS